MRKTLTALMVVVFTHTAFAQSFVQEANFSQVSRRTGGEEYVITLNRPASELYLSLEAELDNANNSSHKLEIHSIKYVTASGETIAASNTMLSGSNLKLSLKLSNNYNIISVIITAESWRSFHGMYVSMEGISSTGEVTHQDDYNQDTQANAEAEEEEAARREAEINAEIERRRQVQCAAEYNSVQRSADRCISYDLRAQLDVYAHTNSRYARLQSRLTKELAPLNACIKLREVKVDQINKGMSNYSSLTNKFSAEKNSINSLKAQVVEATGKKFRCTLSRVGKKHRGTYIGEGATKGKALLAAFKLCPNRQDDGCGDGQKKLRADISCARVN